MKEIPIACQLYSLRDEWSVRPLEVLRFLKETGYTGVEFFGNAFSPEFHAALLRESGMACAGWHTGIEDLEGDAFEKTLARNLTVGNHFICVPWFKADTVDGWKQFCDRLNAAAARLAKYGIRTGYHNHAHEFMPVEGEIPWAIVAENTDPEIILQLDVGNCMNGGADPVAWLKRYAWRNITVHCKPWGRQGGFDLRQGDDAPWEQVIDWCRNGGATEWFIVEYEETADCRSCVRTMYEKLSRI
ncbi:MAG: TIM barrel protein [Lentisphaeria bacterium]|nr:TIM barrel protein [Lentisphaeria bacterium]